MTHQLRACPFCASDDLEIGTDYGISAEYPVPDRTFARCSNCNAIGPKVETPHIARETVTPAAVELAAYKWNDRRCKG